MKKALLKSFQLLVILSLFFATGCEKEKDVSVTDVTLNENKITLAVDEIATLIATVYPDDADNKAVSWTSSDETVAEVTNGLVTAKKVGTAIITVMTEDGNFTAECIVTVIPPLWVEINGIKWAKSNVDAPGTFAANPEDAGMFYQWNRKTGWSSTEPLISHEGGTVWDDSVPEGDIWEKTNDPCPPGWRVPTNDELTRLQNSGSKWATLNGVNGYYFGRGENKVFLPAAGRRSHSDGQLVIVNFGQYWSSTPSNILGAYGILFQSERVTGVSSIHSAGCSVRCVLE